MITKTSHAAGKAARFLRSADTMHRRWPARASMRQVKRAFWMDVELCSTYHNSVVAAWRFQA